MTSKLNLMTEISEDRILPYTLQSSRYIGIVKVCLLYHTVVPAVRTYWNSG